MCIFVAGFSRVRVYRHQSSSCLCLPHDESISSCAAQNHSKMSASGDGMTATGGGDGGGSAVAAAAGSAAAAAATAAATVAEGDEM